MNTDKEIKRIALTMCPNYCYGTPYYLNTRTDRMRRDRQMPACLHIQTAEGTESTTVTPYFQADVRTRRVQVGFADAIKFDEDPEKTLETVEHLLEMCRELIKRMNDSLLWARINEFSYQVLYNTQDGNLVWVLMDFNATEIPGLCED